jgi:S1-C subfamily serine protease
MELTQQLAAERGLPAMTRGLLVTDLVDGSPAVEAGLERDDIIRRIGRTEVMNAVEYRKVLAAVPTGSMILMLVRRGEKPFWVAFPKR